MINNDLPPNDGLSSGIQKLKSSNKMTSLTCLVLVGFLYLGGLGLVCVRSGGYVGVQIQDLILTFSGQPKGK